MTYKRQGLLCSDLFGADGLVHLQKGDSPPGPLGQPAECTTFMAGNLSAAQAEECSLEEHRVSTHRKHLLIRFRFN